MSAVVDGEQFEAANKAILAEIEKVKSLSVTADELHKAIKQFISATLSSRKNEQKIRILATAILQKYDRNGDSKLDRDEWPGQGRWGSFDEANRSGGSGVGLQDLIAYLTELNRRQRLASLDPPDGGAIGRSQDKPEVRAISDAEGAIAEGAARLVSPKGR